MSALLVLLFPAFGFVGAGLLAREFYKFELRHHVVQVDEVANIDLLDLEFSSLLEEETLSSTQS